MNEQFDATINKEIQDYNYSSSAISDPDFLQIRTNTHKARFQRKSSPDSVDPYSLAGYIYQTDPGIEETLNKYAELNAREKLTFFEVLLTNSSDYFKKYRDYFQKLIADIAPDKYNGVTLDVLLLYATTASPDITAFENLLNQNEKLFPSAQSLLPQLVTIERENEFGYQLLQYLRQRKDWHETDGKVRYWDLRDTKDPELNRKFRSFFREELLKEGYNETPWNGCNTLLPVWFDQSEIVEICRQKFQQEPMDIISYISRAGYFQAAYFPVESTLGLIEKAPKLYYKLYLTLILANTRSDLSRAQAGYLLQYFQRFSDELSDSTDSSLLVLVVRSLDKTISYQFITANFPRLYKEWNPPDYLELHYNASKYNWQDAVETGNRLNIFPKTISGPGEYYKCEYMAGNYSFRLNNSAVLDAIFEENKICVRLPDEYGDWPVDYEFIIDSSTKDLAAGGGPGFEALYEFTSLTDKETKYVVYLKLQNRLHKISFIDQSGQPNNQAIYLLLNKALIDSGIKERLLKYSSDTFDIVFVQPAKYKEFMEKLK